MSRLTAKQESFARLVANGSQLSEAYRESYDAKNMQNTTIWQEASKLMDNPKVAERVVALSEQKENSLMVADAKRLRVHVIDRLLQESTDMDNRGGERIKALELIGKLDVVGMFREIKEVEHKQSNVDDLETQLRSKLEAYLGGTAKDITPTTIEADLVEKKPESNSRD